MRGNDTVRGTLFSYVDLEKWVRADHPLRVIRGIVDATLAGLSGDFDALYSPHGRESVPPERLLRALLLFHVDWHNLLIGGSPLALPSHWPSMGTMAG